MGKSFKATGRTLSARSEVFRLLKNDEKEKFAPKYRCDQRFSFAVATQCETYHTMIKETHKQKGRIKSSKKFTCPYYRKCGQGCCPRWETTAHLKEFKRILNEKGKKE